MTKFPIYRHKVKINLVKKSFNRYFLQKMRVLIQISMYFCKNNKIRQMIFNKKNFNLVRNMFKKLLL